MVPVTWTELAWLSPLPALAMSVVSAIRWRVLWARARRIEAAAPAYGIAVADGEAPVAEVVIDLVMPPVRAGLKIEEASREVRVRPFVVKTESGELVTVEPARDAEVRAPLGRAVKIEPYRRYTKSARILPGDKVFLGGTVTTAEPREGSPFRDAGHRTVIASVISADPVGMPAYRAGQRALRYVVWWFIAAVSGPIAYVIPAFILVAAWSWYRSAFASDPWWDKPRHSERLWADAKPAQLAEWA